MKKRVRLIAVLSVLVVLTSCGVSRRAVKDRNKEQSELTVPADSVEQVDTFRHTHPPVVVPHRWNEG